MRVSRRRRSEFVGYEKTDVLTAILAYEDLGDGRFQAKLEQSPFYPEGGGQVTDSGYIEDEETGARAELVEATRLPSDDQVLTFAGEGFAPGMRVRAVVPGGCASRRWPTTPRRTCCTRRCRRCSASTRARRLGGAAGQAALRLHAPAGAHRRGAGRVEQRVNEASSENLPVRAYIVPIEEARRLGAMMLFGEKYGDEVRLVEIAGSRVSSAAARMCARPRRSGRS